jgi:hypothetical protein
MSKRSATLMLLKTVREREEEKKGARRFSG